MVEEFGHRPQVKHGDEGWGWLVALLRVKKPKSHTDPHLYPKAAWPLGYMEETGFASSLN